MSAAVRYEGTVYRPPSESGSLIIQATIGCPHNRCAFCAMYSDKRFRARSTRDVIDDLDSALETCGPSVRTLFLADGNCAALPTRTLIEIARAAHERFPELERITTYGSAKFLVKKSLAEWQEIAAAGINRIHSGSKAETRKPSPRFTKASPPSRRSKLQPRRRGRARPFGLPDGRRRRSRAHTQTRRGQCRVLNAASPRFIRLRTFVPIVGTPWHDRWKDGRLTLLTAHEAVAETLHLVKRLTGPTRLLSDHMSNFVNVFGDIPEEKDEMLAGLRDALGWPMEYFRPPTESLVGVPL